MELKFSKFTFTIRPRDTLRLPPYKGSAFRGSFMHTFRKTVCITMQPECDGCMVRKKCAYYSIFESENNESVVPYLRNVKKIPHPFILEPPLDPRTNFTKDDTLALDLILIGNSSDYLPYFVYTFDRMGQTGMRWRGGFDLDSVDAHTADGTTQRIYDNKEQVLSDAVPVIDGDAVTQTQMLNEDVHMRFLTPTRIVYENKLCSDINADILLKNLYRRVAALSAYHCGGSNDITVDQSFGEEVRVRESKLRWYDWERYSNRQKTRMKMGGFIGSVTLSGDLQKYHQLLALGEILHIGKGTSFGLGKYVIA